MEKRYIQLYSVKDEVAKDFPATLKKLAEIGYTGVEFFGGFMGQDTTKEKLAELGLEPVSAHIGTAQIPSALDKAVGLGIRYIIDPMTPMNTYEEALAAAKVFNETGKVCKERGIQFGYHNHRHEFLESPDGTLWDTLLLNTDPGLVCFQLDVGWATCAGADVLALLKKYAGRFKMIHVKECAKVAGPEKMMDWTKFPKDENGRPQIPPEVIQAFMEQAKWNVPSGKGIIDWPAVRDAALAQGAEAFIVEREYDYIGGDIFKCVEEDCAYLKGL